MNDWGYELLKLFSGGVGCLIILFVAVVAAIILLGGPITLDIYK